MSQRVLVTGASGFVGSHCLPYLFDRGFEVHGITTQPPPNNAAGVEWHQVDLFDVSQVHQCLVGVRPTHLLHLAWETTPGHFWTSARNLDWLLASVALVREFSELGGKRVVIAGSCAEYDWRYGYCSEDLTPIRSVTIYGRCKDALRSLLEAMCAQSHLGWAWARLFFLYGPRERPNRLVPSVICSLLAGVPFHCKGGSLIRDYLYVKDASAALSLLVDADVDGVFNVASGKAREIRDVVTLIAESVGVSDMIRFGDVDSTEQEAAMVVGDPSRLFENTGWRSCYSLEDGMLETIDYWKRDQ